jgi:hypothetical protein
MDYYGVKFPLAKSVPFYVENFNSKSVSLQVFFITNIMFLEWRSILEYKM